MKLLIALLALPTVALAEGYYYPVPANPPGFVYALPPAYIVPQQPAMLPPPVYIQPQRQFVPIPNLSTGTLVPYGGQK